MGRIEMILNRHGDGLYILSEGCWDYGELSYKGTSLEDLLEWHRHCAHYHQYGSSTPDWLILVWGNKTRWNRVPVNLTEEREEKLVEFLLQLQKKKYRAGRY